MFCIITLKSGLGLNNDGKINKKIGGCFKICTRGLNPRPFVPTAVNNVANLLVTVIFVQDDHAFVLFSQ